MTSRLVGVVLVRFNQSEPLAFAHRADIFATARDFHRPQRVVVVDSAVVEKVLVSNVSSPLNGPDDFAHRVLERHLDGDRDVVARVLGRDREPAIVLHLGDQVLLVLVQELVALELGQVVDVGEHLEFEVLARQLVLAVHQHWHRAVRTKVAVVDVARLDTDGWVCVADLGDGEHLVQVLAEEEAERGVANLRLARRPPQGLFAVEPSNHLVGPFASRLHVLVAQLHPLASVGDCILTIELEAVGLHHPVADTVDPVDKVDGQSASVAGLAA